MRRNNPLISLIGRKTVANIFIPFVILCGSLIGLASTGPIFKIQMESWSPYYQPYAASVAVGTSLQWENPTATHHTVTHDGYKNEGPCLFDSGAIPPGGKFTIPSLPPGTYHYHCSLHPIMRGTIVVINNDRVAQLPSNL